MASYQQDPAYADSGAPVRPQAQQSRSQQKRSSYRRTSDPAQSYQSYQGAPVAAAQAPVRQFDPQYDAELNNGYSHSGARNGRDAQMSNPNSKIPRPTSLPPAPDVPRGGPPVSYKDPHSSAGSQSRHRNTTRSYSSRVHAQPPMDARPEYQYSNYEADSVSPIPPAAPPGTRNVSAVNRRPSDPRRNSVPDRSPLQTLEGKLDDISKEEKRARVAEAEHLAQQAAGSMSRSRRDSRRGQGATEQPRNVSGPTAGYRADERLAGPDGRRRQVSMPNTGLLDARHPEKGTIDFGPPWDSQQSASAQTQPDQYRQSRTYYSRDASQAQEAEVTRSTSKAEERPRGGDMNTGLQRGPSYRERSAAKGGRHDPDQYSQGSWDETTGGRSAAVGLGLYKAGDQGPSSGQHNAPGAVRSNSQRQQPSVLRKAPQPDRRQPDAVPESQKQVHEHRMGVFHGARTARKHQDPDPIPPDAVRNVHAEVPKYEVSPQTAGGMRAREMVGFGAADPADMATPPPGGHHRHLPNILHSRHEPDRRYQVAPPLDEWRKAGTARLRAEDFIVDVERKDEPNTAWWERSNSQRRRSGPARQDPVFYDGPHVESTGQTAFSPPLYLKCGPLLRYTGLTRQQPSRAEGRRESTAEQEIWNGTVLIVTDDAKSSRAPPVLRLFSQPMDLLPPPPAELNDQQLNPEYVDPVAGQTKVSRIGKTLYVKPVEHLEEKVDLSRVENDDGLFEETRSAPGYQSESFDGKRKSTTAKSRILKNDGERSGRAREVRGVRLHADRGHTFWRFNLAVELGADQRRVAYRINRGPAVGFWVPARGQTMNIMFHSCNGFSLSVNPDQFSGPDPLWRDVLNTHQTRPFHVMIGGGDQLYNDAVMRNTNLFQEWLAMKNPERKYSASFSTEMQLELEEYYLNRYCMWFSQGLFGMAASQIPMVNMWDDHDIIDGFGSYPHHFMSTAVFAGVGAVAFKYYMLFQQQSLPDETEKDEPSWVLGTSPGPYINQLSRSIFMFLGKQVALLALDCRTERMRDEILSQETYDRIFDRCEREIVKGETKHLIVLLGVPIAYPRLNFLENILTSRVMDPIKALARAGMLGNLINKFDGGVEILDDLDDHWTAKHHKHERNWFIQELQELAAEKSVRITILSGDVHLAAVGQFYSNKKLGIPKDRDHRYIPNVICSAIVNTPPPDLLADVLNRRNKVHHLDDDTDEDMIPLFTSDVNGNPRNNHHLLPHRNWCSIREYHPGTTPPPTPPARSPALDESRPGTLTRTLSLTRRDFTPGNLVRRLSRSGGPPVSYNPGPPSTDGPRHAPQRRHSASAGSASYHATARDSYFPPHHTSHAGAEPEFRPNPFHRRPTGLSEKAARRGGGPATEADERAGHIDLSAGLDIVLNVEVTQGDPAGITTPYRLLVPALDYHGPKDANTARPKSRVDGLLTNLIRLRKRRKQPHELGMHAGSGRERSAQYANEDYAYAQDDNYDDDDEFADYEQQPQPAQAAPQPPPKPAPTSQPARQPSNQRNSARYDYDYAYDDDLDSLDSLDSPALPRGTSPLATPAAVTTAVRRGGGGGAPAAAPLPTAAAGPVPSSKAAKLLGATPAPAARSRMEPRAELDDEDDELDDYHRATRRISGMDYEDVGAERAGQSVGADRGKGSKRRSGWRLWK